MRISTPCRRNRYWKPLHAMAHAPRPTTPTRIIGHKTAAVRASVNAITGPIIASRRIRLQARPECVSSASRSLWNASFIIWLSAFSCRLLIVHFFPQPYIGDALVVACYHNLLALLDRDTIFAACATGPPGSGLRVNDFAGAVFTDGHGDSSQHTDHFVVGGVHALLVRNQHAGEEQENNGGAEESGSHGDQQAEREPHAGEARDQKTGSSEPGKKRRQSDEVERRHRRLVTGARSRAIARAAMRHRCVSGGNMPARVRKVRQMHMPAKSAGDERNRAEQKTDGETGQIKISPSHIPSRCRDHISDHRFRLLGAAPVPRAASGRSASNRRSASPGVFRISPSSNRQRRVSLSRATLIRTSLTSGSLAKRSEPCNSHTSS